MREAFARWACNPVTQLGSGGLHESANNISQVTPATPVTQEMQQPQLGAGAGPVPAVEPGLNKSGVARVTRVTSHKSLDKSCNPIIGGRVTGLQNLPEGLTADQRAEAESWPVPTGRVFLAIMRYLEAQSIASEVAAAGAHHATKAMMARIGGPVQLIADQAEPDLPPEAQNEVDATTARLVAGGWQPDRARVQAPFLVARRLGLAGPNSIVPLDPAETTAAVTALS